MKTYQKSKKIAGPLLLILGILFIVFAGIITKQVNEGSQKIKKTQKSVNAARGISRINPFARKVVDCATRPVQQKINQGEIRVSKFKTLSVIFLVVGILFTVLGSLLIFLGFKKKK
ncbi:MAG: hypothetical protein S4CHLAM7_06250 [Chlamydiae bacterium]|nr:hypothetical protein [Chlamydiota bacterium]